MLECGKAWLTLYHECREARLNAAIGPRDDLLTVVKKKRKLKNIWPYYKVLGGSQRPSFIEQYQEKEDATDRKSDDHINE